MDYVLFGMGYGATLMLLGWALRTFGPERKYKNVDPNDIDQSMLQRRWIRFTQGLGGVISIAGTAMVVFTFIIMLVNPSDETGAFVAQVIWAFVAIAVLIWCWFYVSSFGTLGIWSREAGYRSVLKQSSLTARGRSTDLSSSKVVGQPRGAQQSVEPAIGPSFADAKESYEDDSFVGPDETVSEEFFSDEGYLDTDIEGSASIDSNDMSADENDPEYDFGDSSDTTVPSEIGGRSEAIRRLKERQARSGRASN